ncbi:hypothetical protein G6F70_004192 [Rhizopus microsporus]|nr:hypothetical protein G6F71_004156 [Rhizopus microsporus]KAG1200269.1 hypothetical protein G6F70_004192 [Rhizopus microsporus]KAG1211756.1 hypothetical protein G6F69_004305 [Rhizopus microsporus]KAG1233730.1 hypothetical protein G6F67_004053 [Rhizopus microsporus]KAG1266000.1 hypothetical protein G6F68_003123 [Rhizopus microsporus]
MKRKKGDNPPPPKVERNKGKGIKKYGKTSTVGAKNENPSKIKHVPLPSADFSSSSQTEADHCVWKWFICSKNANDPTGETEFVSVDEYLKSQICNKWKSKQLNNISATGSKRRVHSVLKCESCGTMWNRDVNSSLNINGIFVYKSKYDNESPPLPFKRPSED